MDRMFLNCEKCGKKMIERLPNGLFLFIFGKKKDKEGNLLDYSPVELYVHGSVKLKCLSRNCNHWNTFMYFPNIPQSEFERTTPKGDQKTIKH